MKKIWIIARRELDSYFDSLIAYLMIILFLGLSGFFTWLSNSSNIFLIGQADLQVFFSIAFWTLFFFIPAITMRSLAEENRSGTIELLSTKAIRDWEIVSGKFLSCLLLVMIAVACTFPYYWSVSSLGNIDHGAVTGGYLGLILLSGMYISIGIFASSITQNQIVAFLLALLIGLFFHLLFGILARGQSGWLSQLFEYLSARSHFESISRGVLDSRDFIYFLTLIVLGLFLSTISLNKRNWQD
ncbi:ABC transporter permease subunit [Membranicola marinus]|uniref:ABC transporter permease subunit n=1 Tax=Membranihabitans marinus TaxID=1227546 RepID=A0A953HMQ6_9BACT|nr:ABC transporter permease subunit [Membranihabitans marinus]MBY5958477.1 ABC transporter permease subunit [Membranihabitans marinus]